MKKRNISEYKFLLFFATFYNMLWVFGLFANATVIHFYGLTISASTLIVVLLFSINDVVTEVYGYLMMKKIIWSTLFNLSVMIMLIFLIFSIPNVTTWPDLNYRSLFTETAFVAMASIVAALCSSFMNSFLLSKWKILLEGRLYFVRSVCTTAVAALFFTCIGYSYRLIQLPLSQSLNFIFTAYAIKCVADLIFAIPNTFLQFHLKRIEHCDTYDLGINYNPFLMGTKWLHKK